jgi:DNA polymerase-3 subunit gamma/tau
VAYSPTEGKYKVYIIDEVHMLSIGAFNALLKTLEEPPSYVIFILATTEAHKIPITILSRCQRYDFRRITTETITDRLRELMVEEQVEVEERALAYVAKAADGSMRDALSLLDQCIAFYLGQKLTYDHVLDVLGAVDIDVFSSLFRKICAQDLTAVIRELEQIILQGRELSQFVTDFIWYLRNLLMLKSDQDMEDVLDVSSDHLAQMKEEAALTDADTLMRYIRVFSELSGQIRYASQKRVLVEIALIKLCKPSMESSYDSILQRLSQLEKRMEDGIPMPPSAATGSFPEGDVLKKQPEKISPKALPEDIQKFVQRFPEFRKKMGGMNGVLLKDANVRELPDHGGVQIILREDLPVDEKQLSDDVEAMIEKELHVSIKVQISTPQTDTRPQEPVIDLSQAIAIDIDIE